MERERMKRMQAMEDKSRESRTYCPNAVLIGKDPGTKDAPYWSKTSVGRNDSLRGVLDFSPDLLVLRFGDTIHFQKDTIEVGQPVSPDFIIHR